MVFCFNWFRLGSCRPLFTTNMLSLAVSDFNHIHAQLYRGLGWQIRHFADIHSTCHLFDQQCLMTRDMSRKTNWTLPLSFIFYFGGTNRVLKNQLWINTFVSHDFISPFSSPRMGSHNLRQGRGVTPPSTPALWLFCVALYLTVCNPIYLKQAYRYFLGPEQGG